MKAGRMLIMFALFLLLLVPQAAGADVISQGTCGDGMSWKLADNGVLTISGTGSVQQTEWPESGITKVVIQSGATGIDSEAFLQMEMLTIEIPSSVKYIDKYAFWGCSSLQSISFPKGLETVGEEAFHFCSSLKKVGVSETVQSISGSAFLCCPEFTEITVNTQNPYYSEASIEDVG